MVQAGVWVFPVSRKKTRDDSDSGVVFVVLWLEGGDLFWNLVLGFRLLRNLCDKVSDQLLLFCVRLIEIERTRVRYFQMMEIISFG